MLHDRIGQSSTTAGTGPYELTGLLLKHRIFASEYADGAPVVYYAEKDNVWEANEGVLTIPGIGNPTLSRARLIKSSTGAVINWPDNAVKNVIVDVPAEMFGPLGERLLLGTVGGSANAITVTTLVQTPILKDGMRIVADLTAPTSITNPTLALNALAAKTIVLPDNSAPAVGDIVAGRQMFSYKASTDRWIFLGRPAVTGNFSGLLTSTDAGAGSGPTLELFRDSASPAAADELGQLDFTGRSSTGVKRTYGFVDCIIDDPTNTSEDSQVRLVTSVAGALQAALTAKAGVLIGNPTGADKGAGALNAAAGVYIAGHGTVAQVVRDEETAHSTTTSVIPTDDTLPQQSEGTEILSVAITPTNGNSKIRIRGTVLATHSGAGGQIVLALFRDATANAIGATMGEGANSTSPHGIPIERTFDAVDTTARTYKLRVGPGAAGTVGVNGSTAARLFGGVSAATLEVEEILPQ